MRKQLCLLSLFAALLSAASCGGRRRAPDPVLPVHFVSVEVEVYDPATNLVWEGVEVRIAEAELEWSGLILANPDPNDFYLSDAFGTVLFTEHEIAFADVGFVEDGFGRAVLEPEFDRDEAIVTIELAAPGFPVVYADVLLTWDESDVFVSIPFAPLLPAQLAAASSSEGDERTAPRLGGAARLGDAPVDLRTADQDSAEN